jgi:hypothetical protein
VDQAADGSFQVFFGNGTPYGAPCFPPRETFAEAQADLDEFAGRYGLRLLAETRACRVCGCRDDRIRDSCLDPETEEPCYWVEADLCSACQGRLEKHRRLLDPDPGGAKRKSKITRRRGGAEKGR